jgi:hypothetical protein
VAQSLGIVWIVTVTNGAPGLGVKVVEAIKGRYPQRPISTFGDRGQQKVGTQALWIVWIVPVMDKAPCSALKANKPFVVAPDPQPALPVFVERIDQPIT